MRAATFRRRWIAIGVACGLAIAAFVFGAALGDGTSQVPPSIASRLSLAQLAGQRLVVGFSGTEAPRALRRMIRRGELAGVILFDENLPSRVAGRRLIGSLQAIRRPPQLRDPLLVMVDQEGGLVKRLGGAPTASARQMGAAGPAFARRQGRLTAANLRDVGFNVDLAPVLDVARSGGTIAETNRGFGSTAAQVSDTAVSFAASLQAGGVAATAKHFPGLGAAVENTDFAVERVPLSKAVLRTVDEAPYRRFIADGGAMVMLSTAIYPAFSPRPAAFARPIASGELRDRLGFEGVSISDALESVAVRDFGGPARAGLAAARAGTDLLLFADYRAGVRAGSALLQALRAGALSRPASEAAVARALRLRRGLPGA
ncbi:MAG TPA: glycoside hydrolase family 3 N-terminal domain-containing protein [Solirubrobacterales bacterium]|nr:glycoside hydrolase family 3 N-terminal domain-containing protein [Solirubrobacterales bacterium]